MKEKWKRLRYNQFAAGTAYVSDITWASYIKIAFLHMTLRHIHVSDSRIWELQAVIFHPCLLTAMSVTAEEVGVLPPCDQEVKLLNSGKKSPFRKGPPLLIIDQHIRSQKRPEKPACKWKYKEILYTRNYLGSDKEISWVNVLVEMLLWSPRFKR